MKQNKPNIKIIGAGIAGLWQAYIFALKGYHVSLIERENDTSSEHNVNVQSHATSQYAAGMIAPQCEDATAEPVIKKLGQKSLQLWKAHYPDLVQKGTLVVAHKNEYAEFDNFARKTQNYTYCDRSDIQKIEPDIHHHFAKGLFFPKEAHLNPKYAMRFLREKISHIMNQKGGEIIYGEDGQKYKKNADISIDCRGINARQDIPQLRSVNGEALIVKSREVSFKRPIRILHPKIPIYIVPYGDDLYYVGATMIERKKNEAISVRAMLELLSAAYSLNPAFAEARIVKTISAERPAFPDNLPRITLSDIYQNTQKNKNTYITHANISVNGLFRHGFMIAPALAEITLNYIENGIVHKEIIHENYHQRKRLYA